MPRVHATSSRTFLTVGALVALVFGVAFLAVPSLVMAAYGMTSTVALTVAYRYFGVALVTVFLIWPIRGSRDPAILRPVLLGHAVGDVGLLGGAAYCYRAPAPRSLAAV